MLISVKSMEYLDKMWNIEAKCGRLLEIYLIISKYQRNVGDYKGIIKFMPIHTLHLKIHLFVKFTYIGRYPANMRLFSEEIMKYPQI